jgi:hypothetical protein
VFALPFTGVFVVMGGLRLKGDPVTSVSTACGDAPAGRVRSDAFRGVTGMSGKRNVVRYRIFKSALISNFL